MREPTGGPAAPGEADGMLTFVSSPEFALHAPGAQPESPARLGWALEGVRLARSSAGEMAPVRGGAGADETGWEGIVLPQGPLAAEQLELAHNASYLSFLARYAAAGGGMLSVDTEVTRDSLQVAALASAAVWLGIERAVVTRKPSFAIVRPPGHHAGPARGMGFCLINHVAVAARLYQAAHGGGHARVAIIDWDVHHGNGTADCFAADPGCLYVSLHESPLYPYTGWVTEAGAGPGEGTTVNVPLPGALTDEQACEAMRRVVLPCVAQFRPELVLVSAGFDGHWSDGMSSWQLTATGYHGLASLAREAAEASGTGIPLVALLEGGYTRQALRLGVAAVATGMAGLAPVEEVRDDRASANPAVAASQRRGSQGFRERLDEIVAFQRRYWELV